MEHWVLDENGEPRLEPDLLTWVRWYATAERHVGDDMIGETRVSTVFLSLDHNWHRSSDPNRQPILWETMVFGGPLDESQERYSTRKEALAGHARWVRRCRRKGGA